jgi:glycerol-3-phosphate dehydrogenase
MPQFIEETGGLYVALEGDNENFVADFPQMCANCGIPVRKLPREEALELEPALSPRLIAAYGVDDAAIDPFSVSLANIAQAQSLGTILLRHTEVAGFDLDKNLIQAVRLGNNRSNETSLIKADHVVHAAGVWAARIASLAGLAIPMLYSKGSLIVTSYRIANRAINRLRPPSDGDILMPGGTVSILGTTSVRIQAIDNIRPTVQEVDRIVGEGAKMIPTLEGVRYTRAYAGVRPLLEPQTVCDDRCVSRGFAVIDHALDGVENLTTVTGGKLTTYRLMAEKAANLVCDRLGVHSPCLTRSQPLPLTDSSRWTAPGSGPKQYFDKANPSDHLICECEMVPESAVASILNSVRNQKGVPDLEAIGLRSRLGKGSCQGTFCGLRADAYLLEQAEPGQDEGLTHLKKFLCERWKGENPILWGGQLVRSELKEALYCGLLGLEL